MSVVWRGLFALQAFCGLRVLPIVFPLLQLLCCFRVRCLQFQAVLGFRLSLLASGCGYVCLFFVFERIMLCVALLSYICVEVCNRECLG